VRISGRGPCDCTALDRRPSVWRVGSLFAGARDALSAGFLDAGCAVELVFAAESDPDKLRVLRMHRAPRNELHECWRV
jgi:site-specific DNA-cytosine methylase